MLRALGVSRSTTRIHGSNGAFWEMFERMGSNATAAIGHSVKTCACVVLHPSVCAARVSGALALPRTREPPSESSDQGYVEGLRHQAQSLNYPLWWLSAVVLAESSRGSFALSRSLSFSHLRIVPWTLSRAVSYLYAFLHIILPSSSSSPSYSYSYPSLYITPVAVSTGGLSFCSVPLRHILFSSTCSGITFSNHSFLVLFERFLLGSLMCVCVELLKMADKDDATNCRQHG